MECISRKECYILLVDFIKKCNIGTVVEGLDGEEEIRGITTETVNSFLRDYFKDIKSTCVELNKLPTKELVRKDAEQLILNSQKNKKVGTGEIYMMSIGFELGAMHVLKKINEQLK